MAKINWVQAIKPLLNQYKKKKHPLEFKNTYQLLVMVILSARNNDKNINNIAPKLFDAFPDIPSLAKATSDSLLPYVNKVTNYSNKSKWLIELAQMIGHDENITTNMEKLVELPGIGRKSANVIRREAKEKPEGVIVDLHVVRVAPRIGIAKGSDPKKIEKQIMEAVPQKDWDVGMCISFLGREICRPTNPKCEICPVKTVCAYYKKLTEGKQA